LLSPFERHREGFERELWAFLHGELTHGGASDEELRGERYLYVRVDERGGGISILSISWPEEDCDCPRRMRVSSR
jgi:hypothetical protein